MVRAEVLGTDRAAVRAGLAGTVVVSADHQSGRRAAAMGTREQPGRHTTERPLRAERRSTPARRLELPLGALYEDGRVDELQRMHDGLHLATPDLLGAATLGKRCDGCNSLWIGLLLKDRLEVPVQSAELGGELLLRGSAAPGHPLGRFFLEVAERSEERRVGKECRSRWSPYH